MCFAFKVQECHDGFDGIAIFVDESFSGTQESEESAGTHDTKPDQSTREVLFAVGCRDDRPIVDSGSVVSTCPVDFATSVPTEKSPSQYEVGECVGEISATLRYQA